MKHGLTQKQSDVKKAIKAFTDSHGYAPSMEQIASLTGMRAKSNAHRLAHELVRRGHATIMARRPRTIALID